MVSGRGSALRGRSRYRSRTVTRVRELRDRLPAVAVRYGVRGVHVPVNPRLLSYWIPFVAGVGLMGAGMKTSGVLLVGVSQLVLGVVLVAFTSWDFFADSGRFDVRPSAPHPPPPPPTGPPSTPVRKTYDEAFRRHAVHMVRSTGQPAAAVARDLGVKPSTLAGWVRKDRQDRERRGILDSDGSQAAEKSRRG